MKLSRYGKLLTEAYDLDKPEAPEPELRFYTSRLAGVNGPVLEAMSGSGRFLVPFCESGLDADGVDASADMLAACRRRCAGRGITPGLFQQKLHELDLERRYAAIVIPGTSLGLVVDPDEIAASIARLARHMRPGGRLLFEVQTPRSVPRRPEVMTGRFWTRPDGAVIALRSAGRYDAERRVSESLGIYELFVDGRLVETELDELAIRYWEPTEIAALVSDAGFENVQLTGPYSDRSVTDDDGAISVQCAAPG